MVAFCQSVLLKSDDDDDGSAAEAVMENLSAAQKSPPDLSTSPSIVLFSHKAKLRRFVDGYWSTGVVGNLEIVRLLDKNITYLSMKNKQVRYAVIRGRPKAEVLLSAETESRPKLT